MSTVVANSAEEVKAELKNNQADKLLLLKALLNLDIITNTDIDFVNYFTC